MAAAYVACTDGQSLEIRAMATARGPVDIRDLAVSPLPAVAWPDQAMASPCIALKVDVDTFRGTREGAPRLARLFEKHGCKATFLFSVGPDHTGRAVRRVMQGGLRRARSSAPRSSATTASRRCSTARCCPVRTSAGVLASHMRAIAQAAFETGLHSYDHVRWQDGVANRGPGLGVARACERASKPT
jgi:peptidoglycan/xylan/chitin deacetylase (PgdA/CDA1 family)